MIVDVLDRRGWTGDLGSVKCRERWAVRQGGPISLYVVCVVTEECQRQGGGCKARQGARGKGEGGEQEMQ